MEGKKRYSDEELEEFRAIINQRLEVVKSDYEETMKVLMNKKHQRCKRHFAHI